MMSLILIGAVFTWTATFEQPATLHATLHPDVQLVEIPEGCKANGATVVCEDVTEVTLPLKVRATATPGVLRPVTPSVTGYPGVAAFGPWETLVQHGVAVPAVRVGDGNPFATLNISGVDL